MYTSAILVAGTGPGTDRARRRRPSVERAEPASPLDFGHVQQVAERADLAVDDVIVGRQAVGGDARRVLQHRGIPTRVAPRFARNPVPPVLDVIVAVDGA